MSCNSGVDGVSIICDIPRIYGGYKYEILDGTTGNVLGTVGDLAINCSETTQVIVRNITSNVTYDLGLRVAIRNSDGTQQTVTSLTTIRVKTTEYIPSTTISETTVLPSITTRVISTTTTFTTSTEGHTPTILTTTDNTEATVLPSKTTRVIGTTTVTAISTEGPKTTLRTTTQASGNDCILAQFGCGLTFNEKLSIMIAITAVCTGILIGILSYALRVRASKQRRRKYHIKSRI